MTVLAALFLMKILWGFCHKNYTITIFRLKNNRYNCHFHINHNGL